MGYVTVQQVADQLGGQSLADRLQFVAAAVDAATRRIDGYCGRTFSADSVATPRIYWPVRTTEVWIDDAWSITAVKSDTTGDGTYAETWATTDYLTLPVNGVGHDGRTGWPTRKLRAVDTRTFRVGTAIPSVQVTAKWGWTAVPEPVESACLQLAIMIYRSPDAPFGTAGIADLGLTRVRMPQTVKELLSDYVLGGSGGAWVA